MKILKKLRSENNLPIVLFLILLINYLPLFIGNAHTNSNYSVSTKEMTICFAIEIFLLILFLFKRVKIKKDTIINFSLLIITTIILTIIQIRNYFTGNYETLDFVNIACIFINILLLYIAFLNLDIEEKYIYNFFVGVILVGLVACVFNVILYKAEIIKIVENATFTSVKSFFAHRNQFAIFLYTSIISTVILFFKTNKKIFKFLLVIIFGIFTVSLLLTASRTGILGTAIFLGLFFITTDRIKIKYKLLIFGILIILGFFAVVLILNFYPKLIDVVNNVLIRSNSIKTFTGRSTFWKIGINALIQNPINLSFGIGRFLAIDLISQYNVTQYHSFYMEALMTGGIMEFVYLIGIYLYVAIKIIKSNMEKTYKRIYISMYISYAIYAMSESLSRFSIGCADTICMVFFITIPLLHSNTIKKENNIDNISNKEDNKNFKKIKNIFKKINLPVILFVVILINYLPLIIPNMFSKESFGVSNGFMLAGFLIEIIILFIYFINKFRENKKIELTKEIKINFILLVVTTIILFIVQLINFINNSFKFMDIMNIGCIFINIFLLYILMINEKTEEKNIYTFLKCIICMSLIACIVNIVLYYNEILGIFGICKYDRTIKIKSFFANRNQFAFFLYLAIISNVFVLKIENRIFYKITLPIFLFNLIVTASRTGIMIAVILAVLLFLFTDKLNLKKKVIISIIIILIGILSLILLMNFMPTVWNKINSTLVRSHELKTLSGRTDIWEVGINLIKENPKNFLVGVGRFKAIDLLKNIDGKSFTQFHNIYLDIWTTGGMMELIYCIFIYYTVIRKILKSNLDKKYINIYKIMFITYFIYIGFESCGRFSIGCTDTICLIFFITLPLLHSGSTKELEKIEEGKREE